MNNLSKQDQLAMRDWLRGLLTEMDIQIVFEKKDGTLREMICGLKDVPEYESKTGVTRKENDEVMAVFDREISEWRSFRLDSVKQIKFTLE